MALGVDRYCWIVLTIAALGWLFDTMDQNIFNLVRVPSVHALSAGSSIDEKTIGGIVHRHVFLIGWSAGGIFFGILGDRIGRTRTMVATIIIYALFTGLSALAWNWPSYAVMRFLTGFGVGGEWATPARASALRSLPECATPHGPRHAPSPFQRRRNMTAAVVVVFVVIRQLAMVLRDLARLPALARVLDSGNPSKNRRNGTKPATSKSPPANSSAPSAICSAIQYYAVTPSPRCSAAIAGQGAALGPWLLERRPATRGAQALSPARSRRDED